MKIAEGSSRAAPTVCSASLLSGTVRQRRRQWIHAHQMFGYQVFDKVFLNLKWVNYLEHEDSELLWELLDESDVSTVSPQIV